jgi:hypothetical protein
MVAGTAQFAQADLELLGLGHGVAGQELVDGQVGGHEGQAIGQFKAFLREGAPLAIGTQTHGRFIYQVQGQAWFGPLGRLARPRAEQVPGAQAQVLGQEQPNTELIAGDFVSQHLAILSFQAFGIGGGATLFLAGALGLHELGRVGGIKGVEFFFAGRSRR